MTVACPDCRSVFRVDPAKVPATGVRARCSVCGGILLVQGGTAPLRTPARTPVPAVGAASPPADDRAGAGGGASWATPAGSPGSLPAPFSTPMATRAEPPVEIGRAHV